MLWVAQQSLIFKIIKWRKDIKQIMDHFSNFKKHKVIRMGLNNLIEIKIKIYLKIFWMKFNRK